MPETNGTNAPSSVETNTSKVASPDPPAGSVPDHDTTNDAALVAGSAYTLLTGAAVSTRVVACPTAGVTWVYPTRSVATAEKA